MTTFRNIAISLLRRVGITQIARTRQAISRNPARVLAVIPPRTATCLTLPMLYKGRWDMITWDAARLIG